jgi:GDP-4-dehydro-6-deoxy-D-mannose reductase
MNILITGIGGFTGSHLAEYLLDDFEPIYGTIRGRCRQTSFIDHIKDKLILLECDLTDYNSVQTTIEESQPDYIFHLAAQTFVPTSWRAPQETMNTNVLGTLNLLEAVRKSSFSPRILICGSSEEYGMVNQDDFL